MNQILLVFILPVTWPLSRGGGIIWTMATIEVTRFRLADGVAERSFIEADELFRTEFLYRQPGLVRSTSARGEGSEWMILVLWRSENDAAAAAALAEADSVSAQLMSMVDQATVERMRYTTLD
jgi:hypothetical protein